AGAPDVRGAAIDQVAATVGTAHLPELGSEHYALSAGRKGPADELLVMAPPVHVGGIQEVDSPIEGAVDHRDRRGIVALPVGAGHRHASEPDRRHAQRAVSQLPIFHEVSSGDDEDLVSAYPRARGRSRTLAPRRVRGLRKASGKNGAPLTPAKASDRTTGRRPDRARRAAIENV